MRLHLQQGFLLGPWHVEPLAGTLTGPENNKQRLEPKVMDALVVLAEHAGDVVPRDTLAEAVWNGNPVSDERLRHVIADLRRALDDDRGDPKYIQTIPKRGYRIIGQIELPDDASARSKRNTFPRRLAYVIATAMAVSMVYVSYSRFATDDLQEEAALGNARITGSDQTDKWEMSIAVLPFVNTSDDPDNEFFSDGLTEEILSLLTSIPNLKVAGRTSSFSFKGGNADLREIGETLDVETVLEGSVRMSGDRVRITAQLFDVSEGSQIWSDSYDRVMTDIFAIQDDVAAAIIDALQLRADTNPTHGRPTESMRAYALFLRAKALLHFLHPVENQNPIDLLLQAIEIDPNFAEAYELLAAVYYSHGGVAIKAAEGQMLMGKAAAKALDIDPNLVFARAMYEMGDVENWSPAREIDTLERAVRAQPSNTDLLNQLAFDLFAAGYLREALSVAERMVDLDPLSNAANYRLIEALLAIGSTGEAIEALELLVQLGDEYAVFVLGAINLVSGQDDVAIAYVEAYEEQFDPPDLTWVREWVTLSREPATGQAYLDHRIPQVVASWSFPEDGAWHAWREQLKMSQWYLYFGYLDQYFELILATDLTASTWNDAEVLVRDGIMYRRLGFTAHPKYLEVAEATGIMDVWEQRGPPDYCEKLNRQWVCE